MTRWMITFLLAYQGCNETEIVCADFDTESECQAHAQFPESEVEHGCRWTTVSTVTDTATCTVGDVRNACVEVSGELGGCIRDCEVGSYSQFWRPTEGGVEVLNTVPDDFCGPGIRNDDSWQACYGSAEADAAACACVCG